jgi:diguanylate cyclase (GGDEF)-like protein
VLNLGGRLSERWADLWRWLTPLLGLAAVTSGAGTALSQSEFERLITTGGTLALAITLATIVTNLPLTRTSRRPNVAGAFSVTLAIVAGFVAILTFGLAEFERPELGPSVATVVNLAVLLSAASLAVAEWNSTTYGRSRPMEELAAAAILAASAVLLIPLLIARASNQLRSIHSHDSALTGVAALVAVAGLLLQLLVVNAKASGQHPSSSELRSIAGWAVMCLAALSWHLNLLFARPGEGFWSLAALAAGILLITSALVLKPPSVVPGARSGGRVYEPNGALEAALSATVLGIAVGFALVGTAAASGSELRVALVAIVTTGTLTMAFVVMRSFSSLAQTVSRLDRQRRRFAQESALDELTGILNRRAVELRLTDEIARSARFGHEFAVLFLDVDEFKSVNDVHGHPTGDFALQRVAVSVVECVRSIDIVGRYGGEEFLVVLPETSCEGAENVAGRINSGVRQEFSKRSTPPAGLTVSIGISCFPASGRSAPDLISAADRALYVAKSSGKDRFEVATGLPESAAARDRL